MSNLGVKSPITNIIENNIFEGFYILLLLDLVLLSKKKKPCLAKLYLNCFEIIFRQFDVIPSKWLLFSIIFEMGIFYYKITQKYLKKNDSA